MKSIKCVPQRVFKIVLAAVSLTGAIGFIAIGFTVLPFIGFIVVAIPFIMLAFYVLNSRLDDHCKITFSHH